MTLPDHRLCFRNVAARRGNSLLFAGLNFDLTGGDLIWLQGPNGSGKTTILRLAAGFLVPEKGEVFWKLEAQDAVPEELVAYQGHQDPLDTELTVSQTLNFWTDMYNSQMDIAKCLTLAGLANKQTVACGKLSAGQKRRLVLARLLISNRPVWLLDETATMIDSGGEHLFHSILSDHLKRGGSALLAAHRPVQKIGATASRLVLGAA